MRVLVIDVGGTHVKILASGQKTKRQFVSGSTMTALKMVRAVRSAAHGWKYDRVSIGYPGPVVRGKPTVEPRHVGGGWVELNFAKAFGCPVKIMNDAAMQALGSYEGGSMLFLGLGTGLGSAMIVDGVVVPMELAHLPYRKLTYEDYLGVKALKSAGKKKWRLEVAHVVGLLTAALEPEYVVLGGGNAKKLKDLPPRCRLGANTNAFRGGFRMWDSAKTRKARP